MTEIFKLSDTFLSGYANEDPGFGFDGLGEMVYRRTYSRVKEDGTKEVWWETCRRVVEWVYQTQQKHIEANGLGWDHHKARLSAEEMFDRMFFMKWLPPGRGMWIAGTTALNDESIAAALNNCAYVSTADLGGDDPSKPFRFMMDMSMLGVGVGFGYEGEGALVVKEPVTDHGTIFTVPDSREGWVEALKLVLDGFFIGTKIPDFDYSKVRKKGEPINGFGGTASGPEPLRQLLLDITQVLLKNVGSKITVRTITDLMNMIGVCVVAGNVRRTAQIAIGAPFSEEFAGLKNYSYNHDTKEYEGPMKERAPYGWTSNNSVDAVIGMDYNPFEKRNNVNGEPGFIWMDNARAFGRMCEEPNYLDEKAAGVNPCGEQTLEPYELCCLVETFPTRNANYQDYQRTLKFAYLYAKTVTLCNTHWPETNRVMMRNRRIGTSMSGIAQFIDTNGVEALAEYCDLGYEYIKSLDEIYSDWLCVPRSKKRTSVKPSGTVSLLAGVTPGIHFPEDNFYMRRMRIATDSDMIEPLKEAGYNVEPDLGDPTALVVEVPVHVKNVRKLSEVSMWEQLSIAALMQRYWADNQVSATITFDPETEGNQIANALNYFQFQLKGVSFLPKKDHSVFHQMPYEGITEKQYVDASRKLKPVKWNSTGDKAVGERFCSNDTCTI